MERKLIDGDSVITGYGKVEDDSSIYLLMMHWSLEEPYPGSC